MRGKRSCASKGETSWVKLLGVSILFFFISFFVGVVAFNYIALPLWVGRYKEVSVPDVCGKPLDEAKRILSDWGLKVKVEAQKYSNVPGGIVISQHPLPARRVKKGRSISLCISRGQEKIRVPWVQGLLLEQAENLLKSSGLTIKEVIYEYADEIPNNEVIRTVPPADTLVLRDSEVTIYVSHGLTEFHIPDLTWKTLKEAQVEADRLGLILEPEYIAQPSPLGVVIAQNPLPGSPAKSGDRLNVIVGVPR